MFKCEKFKLFEMYRVTKFSTPIIVDYFYKMYVHCMCIKSLIDMLFIFPKINSSFLSNRLVLIHCFRLELVA